MPFDGGSDISSALPLLAPYAYHPDAPATGIALAYCQAQSFLYSRTHSRLIGYQTYRQTHLTNAVDTRAIIQSAQTAIGQFRVQLPTHATHIVCTAFYGIIGEHASVEVRHRVDIGDGTNLDIGSLFTVEHQGGPSALINLHGYTFYDYAGSHSAEFYVQRANTATTPTSTVCTITASASAIEAGTSNAVPYMPHLIVCRWESI